MGRRGKRSQQLLLIAAATLAAGVLAVPAARAAPTGIPGSGTVAAGQAALVSPGATPAVTAPCAFRQIASCQSTDPGVKVYANYTGNTSACTFTWKTNWGDGSKVKTIVQAAPPDGEVFLAGHTYGTRKQKTYAITVRGTVTGAGCFVTPGTLSFTLLAYVALGDSYSAGDGADDYLRGTGFPADDGNECLRSVNAYPELVDRDLGNTHPNKTDSATFVFRACTGSVIRDFSDRQVTEDKKKVPAQLDSLKGAPGGAGLVTFTIGGNDAGFGPIMEYCATRTAKKPSCKDHSEKSVNAVLATIEPKLAHLYNQVREARGTAKNARVLVLGYPRFFPPHQSSSCPTGDPFHKFKPSDMTWINDVVQRFDTKISDAAKAAGVTYVDVYSAFTGHELCESKPYLHDVVLFPLSHHQVESFHPTTHGQKVFAQLTEKMLR
jgi:lysophospholipase L1-like esterase